MRPVPVAAVERETLRRRELLQRIWPEPDTDTAALTLGPDPDRPVPARRRRVLDLVDGSRTASQIATALGRPAFHTLVDLRRLAAGGLVAAVPPPPAATTPVPEWVAHSSVEDPDVALLRRLRAALEAREALSAAPAEPAPKLPELPKGDRRWPTRPKSSANYRG